MGNNPYERLQPLKTMQKWIQNKVNNNKDIASKIYICTAVCCPKEIGYKKKFIQKYYPEIPIENFRYVYHQYDKVHILKEVHEDFYPDLDAQFIVMIDDTASVLTSIQNKSNYTTIHISSFVDL